MLFDTPIKSVESDGADEVVEEGPALGFIVSPKITPRSTRAITVGSARRSHFTRGRRVLKRCHRCEMTPGDSCVRDSRGSSELKYSSRVVAEGETALTIEYCRALTSGAK